MALPKAEDWKRLESEGWLPLYPFRNMHRNDSLSTHCLVCGLGSSLNDWMAIREQHKDVWTIGVNDIGRLFTPNYLVVLDRLNNHQDLGEINNQRRDAIVGSNASFVFTLCPSLQYDIADKVYTPFTVNPRTSQAIWKSIQSGGMACLSTSVTGAISLAVYMGFDNIGVIGMDMTGSHAFGDIGEHPLSEDNHVKRLDNYLCEFVKALHEHGIQIYNVSTVSKLTALPRWELEAWLNH